MTYLNKRQQLIHQLIHAAKLGNLEELNRCLEQGVDANSFNENDPIQNTALHLASEFGHTECISLLISKGAQVNKARNDENGRSSIHLAAANGYTKAVAILLENGADINKQGKLGMTALYRAATTGKISVVRLLLLYNADPDIKDFLEMSVIESAKLSKQKEIVELLTIYNLIQPALKAINLHLLADQLRLASANASDRETFEKNILRQADMNCDLWMKEYQEEIVKNKQMKSIVGEEKDVLRKIKTLLLDCITFRLTRILIEQKIYLKTPFTSMDNLLSYPLWLENQIASLPYIPLPNPKDLH